MATPKETAAKLLDGTFEFIENDTPYKAKVAAQLVDQLIGNDPHALVRSIAGIPEDLVEVISDGIVNALEQAVLVRLGGL